MVNQRHAHILWLVMRQAAPQHYLHYLDYISSLTAPKICCESDLERYSIFWWETFMSVPYNPTADYVQMTKAHDDVFLKQL